MTLGAGLGATVLNQDIYELSATQKHRLGTRVVRGDCVYRYAKAIVAIDKTCHLVWNTYHQCISYAQIATASVIGDNKIYVTVGATDGIADDSWRPEIAIDSDERIHVVWMDRTNNYGGSGSDIDILYSKGLDYMILANLDFISRPTDLTYEVGTTGNSISWIVSDENISVPTYAIYLNGTELINDTWISNDPIGFSVDDLAIGNYTYNFVAVDGNGEMIADEVEVSVILESIRYPWVNTLAKGFIGFFIAGSVVFVTTLFVVVIKRRKQ